MNFEFFVGLFDGLNEIFSLLGKLILVLHIEHLLFCIFRLLKVSFPDVLHLTLGLTKPLSCLGSAHLYFGQTALLRLILLFRVVLLHYFKIFKDAFTDHFPHVLPSSRSEIVIFFLGRAIKRGDTGFYGVAVRNLLHENSSGGGLLF